MKLLQNQKLLLAFGLVAMVGISLRVVANRRDGSIWNQNANPSRPTAPPVVLAKYWWVTRCSE